MAEANEAMAEGIDSMVRGYLVSLSAKYLECNVTHLAEMLVDAQSGPANDSARSGVFDRIDGWRERIGRERKGLNR